MGGCLSELSLEELWALFPIIIQEHQMVWKDWYREEEQLLIYVIGKQYIRRLSHIGSTSVEGLPAKPTIDLLLELTDDCNLDGLSAALEKNGYLFEAQPSKPAPHMMFMKGYTENGFAEKVFHLHIRYAGDWDELYFRDYLQCHAETAEKYGILKKNLKEQYEHDRDGYTNAKTDFVRQYTTIAKQLWNGKYRL